MFLNLENKNNNNNNINNNIVSNNKKYYTFNENNIIIKFNDKSQINEIPLNINYKAEKEYIETLDIINKNLNLTNNIDIGKLFVESEEKDKPFNNIEYLNKEFFISGIYSGYVDKIRTNLSSENNANLNSNESSENNNCDEYVERYIFLSIGKDKIAIIKLHKEDFFLVEVKSNLIKDKIFNCSDILFKEIIYFDQDNNQPKLTGRKKMENSIPLLNLETYNYSSISYGNYNKNKEQMDLYIKYRKHNKKLVDMIIEAIA